MRHGSMSWAHVCRAAVGGLIAMLLSGCQPGGSVVASSALPPRDTLLISTTDSVAICTMQAGGFVTPGKKLGFMTDCYRRLRVAKALRAEGVRQSEMHWLIPEFHDEQSFKTSPTEFGPVAMVYASPALAGFEEEAQILEHEARAMMEGTTADPAIAGMLAAVVYVDAPPTAQLETPYLQLGLVPQLNCVWIVATPRQSGRPSSGVASWHAYVTHPKPDMPCDSREAAHPLAVVRTTQFPTGGALAGRRFESADVPAVGRFTFTRDGKPLLGVRCATGWCDLGPQRSNGQPDFAPAHFDLSGIPELRDLVQANVAGWYDEQILSDYDPATKRPRPGSVRATLVPYSREYRPADVFDVVLSPRIDVVAYLYLHDDPAGTVYARASWGLKRGLNVITLRSSDPDKWIASVRNGSLTPPHDWANVDKHPHFDQVVISTARFRWASTDDGIWVACGMACCRMEGEM